MLFICIATCFGMGILCLLGYAMRMQGLTWRVLQDDVKMEYFLHDTFWGFLAVFWGLLILGVIGTIIIIVLELVFEISFSYKISRILCDLPKNPEELNNCAANSFCEMLVFIKEHFGVQEKKR